MDRTLLIYKILSGEASEAESRQLKEWIAESDANLSEFLDVKLVWEHGGLAESPPADPDDAFYDGLKKIREKLRIMRAKRRLNRAMALTGFSVSALLIVFTALIYISSNRAPRYIRFDDATMRQVIKTIEDQYPVSIEVERTAIFDCRFTGTFYRQATGDILASISKKLDLRYQVVGQNRFRIIGKGCDQ